MDTEEECGSPRDASLLRRQQLSSASQILGVAYLILGLVVVNCTGIVRHNYKTITPRFEDMFLFHYTNNTAFIQDHVTLWIFGILSFITVILLITCGITTLTLHKKYLHWHNGCYLHVAGGDKYKHLPSLNPEKTSRLILVTAWFACLTITGVLLIGAPDSITPVIVAIVWLLAIFQTQFVLYIRDEFDETDELQQEERS
jgi:hypothetical protein